MENTLRSLWLSLIERANRNNEILFIFQFDRKLYLSELKKGKWSDPTEVSFYEQSEHNMYLPILDDFVGIDKEIGQVLDKFGKTNRRRTPKRKRV